MTTDVKRLTNLCHVTDAAGVVHLANVRRSISREDGSVVSVALSTGCTPNVTNWRAAHQALAIAPCFGFDLPKILHGGVLLVKYEAESLTAPIVTCMKCTTMRWEP